MAVSSHPQPNLPTLQDLMSFVGTLELVPGARVNLITGPNGSGKSSLVTALCVGLAGGMKV